MLKYQSYFKSFRFKSGIIQLHEFNELEQSTLHFILFTVWSTTAHLANIKKDWYQSIPKSEHNNIIPSMCNHIFPSTWLVHSWIVSFRYLRRQHHIWQLFLIQNTLIILCVYINSRSMFYDWMSPYVLQVHKLRCMAIVCPFDFTSYAKC